MKTIHIALATALALAPGFAIAQQVNQNPPAPSTTSSSVEGGNAATTQPKDTRNVRRARKAIPKEPAANTPGSTGTAANLENPRNGTNAQVAGTPAASAEENVDSAKAHSNSDVQK